MRAGPSRGASGKGEFSMNPLAPSDRELPSAEGVNYMAKPYDLDQLTSMVRKSLDTPTSANPFGRG